MPNETAAAKAIEAFKGFDKNLRCRGFQYEIGQTYRTTGEVVRCAEGGFHSCENPLDVWSYYGPATSRFAEVTAAGKIARAENEDTKIASAEITIKAEIKLPDLINWAVQWVLKQTQGSVTSGYRSHAATSGHRSHAATSGDGANAATSGYHSHAATSGSYSHAVTSGSYSHAATSGDGAHAATSGNGAHAATSGSYSHAVTSGDGANAVTSGKQAIAVSIGISGTAKAGEDGWIVLAAWRQTATGWEIATVRSVKVGGPEGVKAGISYRLSECGEFVEAKE